MKQLITGLIKKKILLIVGSTLFSTIGLIVGGIIIIITILLILFAGGDEETNGGGSFVGCGTEGGGFQGQSQYLLDTAKKHHIPQSLFVAILANESWWGKGDNVKLQNNPGSLMGNSNHPWKYKTLQEGVEAYASILEENYIKKGLTTPETIGPIYAPTEGATNDPEHSNNNWIGNVKSIMNQLTSGTEKNSDKDEKGSCTNTGGSLDSLKKYHGKLPKSKKTEFSDNPNPWGECTWWVFNRRKELDIPILGFGDAKDYPIQAKNSGFSIGKKPVQGAVVSIPAYTGGALQYGHVAFVEAVLDGGKRIHISEYNVIPHTYGERDLKVESYMTFIYDKKK